MATELPPIVVKIIADLSALTRGVAEAKGIVSGLDKVEGKATADLDLTSLEARAAEAEEIVSGLDDLEGEATAKLDLTPLKARYADAIALIANLRDKIATVKINASINEMASTIAQAEVMKAKLAEPVEIPVVISRDDLSNMLAQMAIARADAEIAMARAAETLASLGGEGGIGGGPTAAALAGGGAGRMAGWLYATTMVMHAIHLFMPEIIGLTVALSSVAIGFGVLGVAAMDTVHFIQQGYSAVNTAQDAMGKAIPGTTQYAQAVGQLGQAWSGIPLVLQPAVAAINQFFQATAQSPRTAAIQRWVSAQVIIITGLAQQALSAFDPIIVATMQAIQTVEDMISKALGGGGMARLASSIAAMIGPATVELVQLAQALGQIALAFAKAVQGGEGMEFLVQLFRTIAQFLQSSLVQGFIKGWVDFDRMITVIGGDLLHFIGILSSLGLNIKGIGEAIGFFVSAMVMVKTVTSLAGWAGGVMGLAGPTTKALSGFSLLRGVPGAAAGAAGAEGVAAAAADATVASSLLSRGLTGISSIFRKGLVFGGIAVGVTSLAQGFTQMLGISDPLTTLWNKIGGALGIVSRAGKGAIDTVNQYTAALHGNLQMTQAISAAQDMLARSQQSIGASLGQLAGSLQFNLTALASMGGQTAVTASDIRTYYNQMIASGQSVNAALASTAQNFGLVSTTVQTTYANALKAGQTSTSALSTTFQSMAQSATQATQATAQTFADMVAKATDSVNNLIVFLTGKNNSIATWAADAEALIRRGLRPQLVADFAQQAPQDLASLVTATQSQLDTLNAQFDASMMLVALSGQNGIATFISRITEGLQSGTPSIVAAAQQLATQLGTALNAAGLPGVSIPQPYTSPAALAAIQSAMTAMPPDVVQALVGRVTGVTPVSSDLVTQSANSLASAANSVSGQSSAIAKMISGLTIAAAAVLLGGRTLQTAATDLKTAAIASGVSGITSGGGGVLGGLLGGAGGGLLGKLASGFAGLVDLVGPAGVVLGALAAFAGSVATLTYFFNQWAHQPAAGGTPTGPGSTFYKEAQQAHGTAYANALNAYVNAVTGQTFFGHPLPPQGPVAPPPLTPGMPGYKGGGYLKPPIQPRQFGGPVVAGLSYLVGERGRPEIFVPNISGRIVPTSGATSGVPNSMSTVYQIQHLVVVAQNPAQLEQQLAQRARMSNLTNVPVPAGNTGVRGAL